MNITFSSNKLEKILTNRALIKKNYSKNYKNLMNRLSELQLAQNLKDIPSSPPPRRHILKGNYEGCFGIDYSKNFRIIIKPTGTFNILDLSTIVDIEILALEDYH